MSRLVISGVLAGMLTEEERKHFIVRADKIGREADLESLKGKEFVQVHVSELVEQVEPTLPRRLTNVVTHPDYHPSFMRVGVRVDGEERNDIYWYDLDQMRYATNAKLTPAIAGLIDPYWRYPETRQQRRARERWERSHA